MTTRPFLQPVIHPALALVSGSAFHRATPEVIQAARPDRGTTSSMRCCQSLHYGSLHYGVSLLVLLLLMTLTPAVAHSQTAPQPPTAAGPGTAPDQTLREGRVHFQIGDYSFQMPVAGLQQQSFQKQTLTSQFQDGSSLAVSIVPRADFEERSTISAAQYLKDLFGEQQPTSTILQVIRDRNARDVTEKQIESRGHLTFYVLTYSDHQAIYVADEYQPEYFISVESRNQPLQPILESFQGGKASASAPGATPTP